jgi:hypothetical protein
MIVCLFIVLYSFQNVVADTYTIDQTAAISSPAISDDDHGKSEASQQLHCNRLGKHYHGLPSVYQNNSPFHSIDNSFHRQIHIIINYITYQIILLIDTPLQELLYGSWFTPLIWM